jgi:hypothetical protein
MAQKNMNQNKTTDKYFEWRALQNFCKFTFPCHPEAVRPKDLFVDFFVLKRKEEILRFAQNDSAGFWNSITKTEESLF